MNFVVFRVVVQWSVYVSDSHLFTQVKVSLLVFFFDFQDLMHVRRLILDKFEPSS